VIFYVLVFRPYPVSRAGGCGDTDLIQLAFPATRDTGGTIVIVSIQNTDPERAAVYGHIPCRIIQGTPESSVQIHLHAVRCQILVIGGGRKIPLIRTCGRVGKLTAGTTYIEEEVAVKLFEEVIGFCSAGIDPLGY